MDMNKRISFGRRKSDWLIPLGFLTVGVIAAFWASYNRTQKAALENENKYLQVQLQNLERVVKQYEKREGKNATGPSGSAGEAKSMRRPVPGGNVNVAPAGAAKSSSTARSVSPPASAPQ